MNENVIPKEITKPMDFAEFLQFIPPNSSRVIERPFYPRIHAAQKHVLKPPNLRLHCINCDGVRTFREEESQQEIIVTQEGKDTFLKYKCGDCFKYTKKFAISITRAIADAGSYNSDALIQKIGEMPSFGPPLPPKFIKLIGPDRDLFLKGRKCEDQGLGIASFAYYRRVIENQKGRIIDAIENVSKILNNDQELLKSLAEARKENQFTKAVDAIKPIIPEALLIEGQNPLILLHSALSEGIHNKSDEICLELAVHIRIILVLFSEKLNNIIDEQKEVKQAVNALMSLKRSKAAAKE